MTWSCWGGLGGGELPLWRGGSGRDAAETNINYCGGRFEAQACCWRLHHMTKWPLSVVSESSRLELVEMLRNFHGRDWTDDRGLSFHWPTWDCVLCILIVIVLLVLEPIVIPFCHLQKSQRVCGTNGGFSSQLEPVVVVVGLPVQMCPSPTPTSECLHRHQNMGPWKHPVGQLCWSRSC